MRRRLPLGIWILGFVSLLMDVSSEMIHSLLPLFLVTGLGTSALTLGLIEGAAEATALIVKVFSGVVSDWMGRRKALAVVGYGLGALSKPLFALAPQVGVVVAARLIDRVGKGLRGAPRDALVADLAPPGLRGEAFGLRQSLDTVGAFAGPLLAVGLMVAFAGDYRTVFWVAVIPAVLSVALLAFGLTEPRTRAPRRGFPISRAALAVLPRAFWQVVAVGALFTLARFSEAFLLLRAEEGGLAPAQVPLVLVAMNAVYAASAWPVGRLSDRIGESGLLGLGMGVLVVADLILASSGRWEVVGLGALVWGLHMGLTQGLLAAMVARTAPKDLRGTAFGLYSLVSGGALLIASALAGALWDIAGPGATFLASAALALAALVCLRRTGG